MQGVGIVDHFGDAAHLGLVARADDHAFALSVGDEGAGEGEVGAIGEDRVGGKRLALLFGWHGLTGQGRLIDL